MASASLQQQNVNIGDRLLAPDDLVIVGDGQVSFEEDVTCGTNVRVIAEGRDIRIGARAWLGDNTEIRASVGSNSIIASDCVIPEDIPANVVVKGNPAKHVWQVC
jgi:acetyltransferase-like isoleucine patch superfamily enzyme